MTITRRKVLGAALGLPVLAVLSTTVQAATPRVYTEGGGIAVDGTDVVAYFTEGKAVAGDAGITHEWNGSTWQFSSEENKAAFAADPEAYAPQYGGYCAYAVSEGYTAPTDPAAWSIVDDKLYLNYSRSVRALWNVSKRSRIEAGDRNWPGVLN